VGIARAIVANPQVIVADEPTGSLDAETTEQILTLLQRVNNELGMTLLMVTHDAEAALRARRQVRLERGKLLENGELILPPPTIRAA
jgi:putative ABC transport system ATP-binding protein